MTASPQPAIVVYCATTAHFSLYHPLRLQLKEKLQAFGVMSTLWLSHPGKSGHNAQVLRLH